MYSIFSDVLMLFENRELSTLGSECYFSLIRTKPCNPCTRRVHNVYTAYTINEGQTNDYRLVFRATLAILELKKTFIFLQKETTLFYFS
jgi:hypothetical protein